MTATAVILQKIWVGLLHLLRDAGQVIRSAVIVVFSSQSTLSGLLLRAMLTAFVHALMMSADADTVCGAEYGARSADRTNRRNGYRHRDWGTRAGTIELAIPKLREGSYFPEWLLERRKRAERALISVMATS